MTSGDDLERLSHVAQRLRASSGLGRSDTLHRLFDYLLERTLSGTAPREVDIAADVFGKTDSDLLADASVRVAIHRLRRKLEDHYAGPGAGDADQLVLPKNDYRFQLVSAVQGDVAAVPSPARTTPAPVRLRAGAALLLGVLLGGALLLFAQALIKPEDPLTGVRSSSLWGPLMDGTRPLTIVTGDYYLLGERDRPDADPARLVREFSVNSRDELAELLMVRPELQGRYVDLGLYYLPVGTAYALKSVMPVLAGRAARVPVLISSSKLTPAQLKSGDLAYVGLLSGLGLLQQPVLANSRFAIGGSFDEIIDTGTGRIYVADPPSEGETARRNYAYVAMLPGPGGNRILIIAGTRDPALLQAADLVTSPAAIEAMSKAGKGGYFEALYAVDGVGEENLKGTLIAAGPRSGEGLWDAMRDPD